MFLTVYTRLSYLLIFLLMVVSGYAQNEENSSFTFSKTSSFKLLDVKQNKAVTISAKEKPLSLFVFLSPECPLCQNYTKTLNQLQEKFKQKVSFIGIVPGDAYSLKDVTDFEKKYEIDFTMYIDAKEKLTRYLQASVTPQVVLLNNKGNLIYTGAIDDWIVSLGKKRLQVTQYYLQDAIQQSLQPEIVKIKKTNAIGCKINDY